MIIYYALSLLSLSLCPSSPPFFVDAKIILLFSYNVVVVVVVVVVDQFLLKCVVLLKYFLQCRV